MNQFTKNNYHYFFFIIFFTIQIFVFNDYGFSNDEELSRTNGLVSYNYILEKLNISIFEPHKNIQNLNSYVDKDYGVAFELPLVFIEKIFNLKDDQSIYLARHYAVSLSFFIASIYFFLTLNKFFSKEISIIGTLIFIIHPRIFAQSFYNSKDIGFLFYFCICNYYFISFFFKQNLKNIILLSLVISLAIGTRIMAIMIPLLFLFFFIMQNLDKKTYYRFYLLIPFLFFLMVFTIIFWPYLWDDPSRFFVALISMSDFRFLGEVFFNGEYFVAKYMPWYYVPVTILITTPIYYIVLFLVGSFFIFKKSIINLLNLKNNSDNIWKNQLELYLIYSLIIVFVTVGLIIELNSTVYTGWRQLYFIYPSIIFICIYGLNILLSVNNIRPYFYTIFFFSIFINLLWIYRNHPYQYTFYNSLIGKNNIKNFELDYWGVSNLDTLNALARIKNKDIYKIYIYSVSPYHYSLNMIDSNNKKKFIFVQNIKDADFILTNHYYQEKYFFSNKHPEYMELYLNKNFNLVYEIKSNNVRINSIYEKK